MMLKSLNRIRIAETVNAKFFLLDGNDETYEARTICEEEN